MSAIDDLIALLNARGDSQYGGEPVTQLEHALQAAALAEAENVPDALIAAALLHDIGHLLHDYPDDAPDNGLDDLHEQRGYWFVRKWFSADVAEPIRLHVPAKRYLCAIEPTYLSELSPASLTSLRLQGGPMTVEEVAAFEQFSHAEAAVRLRRWDDAAKVPQLPTPSLEHFATYLKQLANKDHLA